MKQLQRCAVFCLLTVLMAGCAGLAGEPAIVGALPTATAAVVQAINLPTTVPDVEQGARVFAENCTRCHGASGKGDGELVQSGQITEIVDFTDAQVSQGASPIDWFRIVTNGNLEKLMPPWGDSLSEADRWAVTQYVYTLPNTSAQIAEGQIVWSANCVECHGETGEGTDKGAPLPNLLEISTTDALAVLTNGIPDKMPAFADKLTAEQRAAVIAYARTLNSASAPVELADASATEPAITAPNATQEVGAVVAPSSTQEAGAESTVTGVVSGTVVNQTDGSSVPADLPLNLHVVNNADSASAQTFSGTVSADGSYRFENIPIQAGWEYIVTTTYQNVVFNSNPVTGNPATQQIEIPLSIYEITDDPANIYVNGMLIMLQANTQPDQLMVIQIISFSNTSDRVFLQQQNGGSASVSVRLPAGVAYQDFSGGVYSVSPDGTQVWDTQPVLPGDSHVMHIAFAAPYPGSTTLRQPLDFALNGQVELLAEDGNISVSGDGIASLGTRQLGERNYISYGGSFSRAAGEPLSYTISGTTSTQATGTPTANNTVNILAYALIGAGLLAIGAAFGFFMRERKDERSSPDVSANALIKQIAELDVRYHEGKLDEAAYNKQRDTLKARLMATMKAEASAKPRA